MKNNGLAAALTIPVLALLVMSYQNCSGGFVFDPKTSELQSLTEGDLKIKFVDVAAPDEPLDPTKELTVGHSYLLTADGQNVAFRTGMSWELESATMASFDLLDSSTTDAESRLTCQEAGVVKVTVRILLSNNKELYGSHLRKCVDASVSPNPTPVGTPDPQPTVSPTPAPNVVTFRIPAGTGNNPWNTLGTAVRVFVGQTLQIVNDDSVPHRLHTPESPCAHQPQASAPGGTYNCVIASAELASAGRLYDHGAGVNAKFYVNALNGNQLYANTCSGCHGALAVSAKKKRSAQQIRAALMNVTAMKTLQVTDDQIEAIAYSLGQ